MSLHVWASLPRVLHVTQIARLLKEGHVDSSWQRSASTRFLARNLCVLVSKINTIGEATSTRLFPALRINKCDAASEWPGFGFPSMRTQLKP